MAHDSKADAAASGADVQTLDAEEFDAMHSIVIYEAGPNDELEGLMDVRLGSRLEWRGLVRRVPNVGSVSKRWYVLTAAGRAAVRASEHGGSR
jgi:hypothetical protein